MHGNASAQRPRRLGNHSEFLGIGRAWRCSPNISRTMAAARDWREGHASDLFGDGCADGVPSCASLLTSGSATMGSRPAAHRWDGVIIAVDHLEERTELFADDAVSLARQRALKRSTMNARVDAIASMVNASDRPAIVWCDLNDESSALAKPCRCGRGSR